MQKSKKEATNFDTEFTKEDPVLTPINQEIVKTIDQVKKYFKTDIFDLALSRAQGVIMSVSQNKQMKPKILHGLILMTYLFTGGVCRIQLP